MRKIDDGYVSIEMERKGGEFVVNLDAVQYRLEAMGQYELFLGASHVLLGGKVVTASDERVELAYELPAHAETVMEAVKKAELFERVEIARKFSILKQDGAGAVQFFIHPENLFLVSNQLYVAHRGLTGIIDPKVANFEQFLEQYKALVVSTLNPRYKYEEVVAGKVKVRDKGLRAILSATTISEIEADLDEQYHALNTARKVTERSVKKSKYGLFKFLTIGFAVLIIGIGIWLGLLLENTVPRQNRIIEAQAAYMVNNFNEATSILSDDDPRTLPPAVQYMLAASYVQLSTLTTDQRQAVINNLSPSSSEIELRYWIYMGRGALDEALDIAYRLDSIHLQIHAYSYRYNYTNANMDLPGTERQESLTRYRTRMEELVALLDGEDPLELSLLEDVVPESSEDEDDDENDEDEEESEDEDEGDEENGEE